MREVEFLTPPELDAKKERETDLHSLYNILNIISLHLSELSLDFPDYEQPFAELGRMIFGLSKRFRTEEDLAPLLPQVRESESKVMAQLLAMKDGIDDPKQLASMAAAIENAESIYQILSVRLDELEYRLENPDIQVRIHKDALQAQVQDVLDAIEKNAKGRYYIRYNLALKQENDYYIDLKVGSIDPSGMLTMPLRLNDVLRDLLANARKYTDPGGEITMAVYQDAESIHCIIEDDGCGIPEDELERVSEFGYRASNVRGRRTMGGGFGLTKAVWLVLRWGGRFRIASALGEGTCVRFSIPNRSH